MEKVTKKRTWIKWAVPAAACLALAVMAFPVYRVLNPATPDAHSYVVGNGVGEVQNMTTDTGGSDGQEIPGGAYIGNEADVAVQEEGTMAYENLMDFFKKTYGADTYPDWYGGSYLDQSGHLTVNVVSSETSGADDKELYIQIMEWAGSQQVVFSDVKYSLAFLRDLQKQVEALPELKAISSWGCGVNEESGQVKLTVPQADEALLVALAKLDPDDDAILVQVGDAFSIGTEDVAGGEPFIDMDGDPAGYGISDLPGKLPAIEGKLTDTDSEE